MEGNGLVPVNVSVFFGHVCVSYKTKATVSWFSALVFSQRDTQDASALVIRRAETKETHLFLAQGKERESLSSVLKKTCSPHSLSFTFHERMQGRNSNSKELLSFPSPE